MAKKEFIKPEIKIVKLETESLLAGSGGGENAGGVGNAKSTIMDTVEDPDTESSWGDTWKD